MPRPPDTPRQAHRHHFAAYGDPRELVRRPSLSQLIRRTLHVRQYTQNITRDIAHVQHTFVESASPAEGLRAVQTGGSGSGSGAQTRGSASGAATPNHLASAPTGAPSAAELHRRLASVNLDQREASTSTAVPDDETSHDIHQVISIQVPLSAVPTSSRPPVVSSHRIKWSVRRQFAALLTVQALIRNADGHTSELRCALPLLLLAPALAEEARLASSGAQSVRARTSTSLTRQLLFGPTGALVPTSAEEAAEPLPSYQSHWRDPCVAAPAASLIDRVASSSLATSRLSSPAHTPLHTPSPSRPASPTGDRPTFAQPTLPESLARADPQPSSSRPRPMSRRASSGRSSRPPSPNGSHVSTSPGSHHGGGFFSSLSKPLRPLAAMSRGHSTTSHPTSHPTSPFASTSHSPSGSGGPSPAAPELDATPRPPAHELDAEEENARISRVPSYQHGDWLGGVVPLETQRGLPDYSA